MSHRYVGSMLTTDCRHANNIESTVLFHILMSCSVLNMLHKWRSQFPDGVWSQCVMAGMCMCVLPVFEPVTEGVYTLGQRGRLHPVLLLPLLVVLLCSHRGQLLDGGGGGDDHSVWTLPCQQVLVDHQHTLQKLYTHTHTEVIELEVSGLNYVKFIWSASE